MKQYPPQIGSHFEEDQEEILKERGSRSLKESSLVLDPDDMDEFFKRTYDKRIKYFRLVDLPFFHMAHAKNESHKRSTGDFLINLEDKCKYIERLGLDVAHPNEEYPIIREETAHSTSIKTENW